MGPTCRGADETRGAGMAENDKLEIINPPNTLRSKVTVGGPGAVDAATIERAEKVIGSMAASYVDWAAEDLKKLGAALEGLNSGQGTKRDAIAAIFETSHDMKGQGGSFGYPLITAIANELCRLIEKIEGEPSPDEVGAIRIHVDSLRLVLKERIKGDGGKQGEAMLKGLRQVIDKLTVA